MDKNLLYLQIIFLAAVVVNLIAEKQIFLKVLLLLLTFLFFIKEIDEYVYNKDKYLYVGIGFTSILFLFILSNYISHIYYLLFFMCAVILYLYLYKILFNTTYGTVIKSTSKEVTFKIDDAFFKTKKEFTLKYFKKIEVGSTIILELSKSIVNKKPIKIKKVILK